jgi:hypothetical protein
MIHCNTLLGIDYPRAERERAISSDLRRHEMGRPRHALAGLRGDTRSPECVEPMAFESGRVATENLQGHQSL